MKRLMMFTVLLGVVITATLEGHSHDAEALPDSLAGLLGEGKFAQASNLWDEQGDLLASSTFHPAFGRPDIAHALQQRYAGWTIKKLGDVRHWAAGEEADTEGIAFVNWVYEVKNKKTNASHKELFVAVAKRRHVNPKDAPVEKEHAEQYRFVTVRLLSLPLPASKQ
jgi:hypothetical protein